VTTIFILFKKGGLTMKRLRLGIQLAICLLVSLMLLLCGCSRTETREIPASSAPETVQATPESVKKNTSLTPQEELEKLSLTPQTTQCPICGGTDLKVTLASSEVQKGSMRAQKCIHYLYGDDYVSPLNLRVCDVCLSCTYPEDPWHGDCYDVPLGSSTVCHGYQ
jgi:hypothetical protein